MADNMDPVEKKRRQTDDSMEKMLARLTQSFTQIMDKTLAKQAEENEQMMERMKEENKTIAEKHALGWRENSIALVHRVAEGFNLKLQESEDRTQVLLEQVKQVAMEAKSNTTAMSKELIEIKEQLKTINMKEDNTEVKNLKAGDTYVPKASPTDEKQRTLTFGNFPEDDGVYAFGKKFAVRGAARFKTQEAMMAYLRKTDTEKQFEVDGHRIYMNKDATKTPEDLAREKAVRKLVKAFIVGVGGDAELTKKDLHTDYRKGVVWYKEVRVGEYAGGKMHLKGEGTKVEALFSNYME